MQLIKVPESLDADTIEEDLNFTEEYFAQFEETLAQSRSLLKERNNTIEELSGSVQDLQGQLSRANRLNDEKQKTIDELTERVNSIEDQKKARLKRKKKRLAFIKFLWSIIWKLLIVAAGVVTIWGVCRLMNWDFPTWLGLVLSAVGLVISELPFLRKRWNQYREEINRS